MAEQSEEERIEARLTELKARVVEQEAVLTELWLQMLDLRVKRAAIRKILEEDDSNGPH